MIDLFSEFTNRMAANYALLLGRLMDCPIVDIMRWASAVLFMVWVARLTLHGLLTRRMIAKATTFHPEKDRALLNLYRGLAAGAGLGRVPPLFQSSHSRFPAFTLGVLRPVVFLHPGLARSLDREELACALTHELVHIKRRDHLRMWSLDLTTALIPVAMIQFFAMEFSCQPLDVLVIFAGTLTLVGLTRLALLRWFLIAREHSCDDRTVAITKAPLPLAASLIKTWQFIRASNPRHNGNRLAWSALMLANGPSVEQRVRRLLAYRAPRLRPAIAKVARVLVVSLSLAYGWFLWHFHVDQAYQPVLEKCNPPACSPAACAPACAPAFLPQE